FFFFSSRRRHTRCYRDWSSDVCSSDNKPADVVTVGEILASLKKLDYVGGMAYLGALVDNVPTAANIRRYAEIVRERAILRRLAAAGGEIADAAYNPLGRSVREV